MATFWKRSLQFTCHEDVWFLQACIWVRRKSKIYWCSFNPFHESGRHCDLRNIFWKPFRGRKDHIFFLKMICKSAHYWALKEDRMFTALTIKAILLYFVSSSKYQSLQIPLFVFIYLFEFLLFLLKSLRLLAEFLRLSFKNPQGFF